MKLTPLSSSLLFLSLMLGTSVIACPIDATADSDTGQARPNSRPKAKGPVTSLPTATIGTGSDANVRVNATGMTVTATTGTGGSVTVPPSRPPPPARGNPLGVTTETGVPASATVSAQGRTSIVKAGTPKDVCARAIRIETSLPAYDNTDGPWEVLNGKMGMERFKSMYVALLIALFFIYFL